MRNGYADGNAVNGPPHPHPHEPPVADFPPPRPAGERKGLDIVNPDTGKAITVVASKPGQHSDMGPQRGPLPITNPQTGEAIVAPLTPEKKAAPAPVALDPYDSFLVLAEPRRCHAIPIVDPKTMTTLPVEALQPTAHMDAEHTSEEDFDEAPDTEQSEASRAARALEEAVKFQTPEDPVDEVPTVTETLIQSDDEVSHHSHENASDKQHMEVPVPKRSSLEPTSSANSFSTHSSEPHALDMSMSTQGYSATADTPTTEEPESCWQEQTEVHKLDEKSLTDLAREHEEESRDEVDENSAVPSPDTVSTDDTPGPSDEEKDSARSHRHAAQMQEEKRSRSASPRMHTEHPEYTETAEHYIASPATIPVPSKKMYSVGLLKSMNRLDFPAPAFLKNPLLAEIYVPHPRDYYGSRDVFGTENAAPQECLLTDTCFSQLLRRDDMGTQQQQPLRQNGRQVKGHPLAPSLENRAENPFTKAQELPEEDQVVKQITGVLNKVTPEKYEQLLARMYEILDTNNDKITEQLLERIIAEVHERALDQPNYSQMYAQLCADICTRIHANKQMAEDEVEGRAQAQSALDNFRRILLNRCQQRFSEGVDSKYQQEEPKGEMTPEEQAEAEKEQKFRHRSKGNIRFIGELFKRSMLSERIMHKVVKKLLLETPHQTAQHADSLEVLCTLLKTAGKQLDRPMAVDYMTHYFNTLSDLANHHTLPRIRFMVMDIIELRGNDWVSRRQEAKALKLDELEKKLLEEERARDTRGNGYKSHSFGGHSHSWNGSAAGTPSNSSVSSYGSSFNGSFNGNRAAMVGRGCYEGPRELLTPKVRRPSQQLTPTKSPAAGAQGCRSERGATWVDTAALSPSSSSPSPSPHFSPSESPHLGAGDQDWRPIRQHSCTSESSLPEMLQEGGCMVTEEELRFESLAKTMLDEWHMPQEEMLRRQNALAMLDSIPDCDQQHFWVCAMEFASRTNKYGQYRATLVVLFQFFIGHQKLTVPNLVNNLTQMVVRGCKFETWVDCPGFWANLASIVVQLMARMVLNCHHLVDICGPFAQESQTAAGREFLTRVMEKIQQAKQDVPHELYNQQVALTLCQSLKQRQLSPGANVGTVEDCIRTLSC
jgi:hypothetical protein